MSAAEILPLASAAVLPAAPGALDPAVPGPLDPVLLAGVPFEDASPDDLTFSTDAPRLPALAVRRAEPAGLPGTVLELRVLGASHQVALERDGHEWIETLACRPGHDPFLPTVLRRAGPAPFAADYETGCTVTGHSRRGLLRQVERLLGTSRSAPHALVVRFAGDPSALTGVCAWEDGAGGLLWRTWHVYPQVRRIVHSRSVLRLLPGPGPAVAR